MHKMVSYRTGSAYVPQGICAALLYLLCARRMGMIMGLMSVFPKLALCSAPGLA